MAVFALLAIRIPIYGNFFLHLQNSRCVSAALVL